MNKPQEQFWKTKSLAEMTCEEWESLCDGCARCCVHKLEDDASGEVRYTNVACRFLDIETCRCTQYPYREQVGAQCLCLTAETVRKLTWLPPTCAYRLLAQGKELPAWHPLLTGDPGSALKAGISVRNRVIPEDEAGNPEDHVII